MSPNYNYYDQLQGSKPLILADRNCPRCSSELGALKPDRVWCTNPKCTYAELHITGEGVMLLKFKKL